MRNLVSYDDITPEAQPAASSAHSARQSSNPPSKKRKWNNQHSNNQKRATQHWDDPSASASLAYDPPPSQVEAATNSTVGAKKGGIVYSGAETSRELTHEEIWDDSALIDAWNAAQEEYEALNGPEKSWKHEPVHKSSLWYNAPSDKVQDKTQTSTKSEVEVPDESAEDSRPLDFNTFVPSYDPSLAIPTTASSQAATTQAPGLTGAPPMVNRDEAFQNALSAMYWTGYWTAAYYYQGATNTQEQAGNEEGVGGEVEEEEEEEIEMEEENDELVSTQR